MLLPLPGIQHLSQFQVWQRKGACLFPFSEEGRKNDPIKTDNKYATNGKRMQDNNKKE